MKRILLIMLIGIAGCAFIYLINGHSTSSVDENDHSSDSISLPETQLYKDLKIRFFEEGIPLTHKIGCGFFPQSFKNYSLRTYALNDTLSVLENDTLFIWNQDSTEPDYVGSYFTLLFTSGGECLYTDFINLDRTQYIKYRTDSVFPELNRELRNENLDFFRLIVILKSKDFKLIRQWDEQKLSQMVRNKDPETWDEYLISQGKTLLTRVIFKNGKITQLDTISSYRNSNIIMHTAEAYFLYRTRDYLRVIRERNHYRELYLNRIAEYDR